MKIERAERQTLLASHPVLASHLKSYQQLAFDPANSLYRPGEEVWLESDADQPTVLSEELAAKLNRETEEEMAALKDSFSPNPGSLESVGSPIVTIPAASMEDFAQRFGGVFTKLAEALDWSEFVVISGARLPLLAQDNGYPPVVDAQNSLLQAGLTKTGYHGLSCDLEGFVSILGALFWIARCNAAAPHILFSAIGSASVGTLCQYANIHYDIYDRAEADRLQDALDPHGFFALPDGVCREIFTPAPGVPGQAIKN